MVASKSVSTLEGAIWGVHTVDISAHEGPSPRFELVYLVLLADGAPAQFRYQIELLRDRPPLVLHIR